MSILLCPFLARATSTVNICDRGEIGDLIAQSVGDSTCAQVDKIKMSRLLFLDLSSMEIVRIPENALAGLDSLKTIIFDKNLIITLMDRPSPENREDSEKDNTPTGGLLPGDHSPFIPAN